MFRIVCLGDSITYGHPYGPKASWVALTEKKLNGIQANEETGQPNRANQVVQMINQGVNGETLGEMRERFARDVITTPRPTHVIVMGGTNDAWWGWPLMESQRHLQAMVAEAQQGGIQPLVGVTIPICRKLVEREFATSQEEIQVMVDWLDSFREWLQKARLAPLIDFYSALWDPTAQDGQAEYFSDGGHPNRTGYEAMAQAAFQALSRLLVPPA